MPVPDLVISGTCAQDGWQDAVSRAGPRGPWAWMRRDVRHDGGARCCAGQWRGRRRAGRPAARERASRVRRDYTNIPADALGCAHLRVIALPLLVGEKERVTHVAAMVSPAPEVVAGERCWRVLKSAARVAEEHAMERLCDGSMEVDGARDENRVVHQTLAEGMQLLRDGVSEADRAVVVEVNRAETFRDLVVA